MIEDVVLSLFWPVPRYRDTTYFLDHGRLFAADGPSTSPYAANALLPMSDLEISPHAAPDPLAMTDHGEPRGHRLHQQAILPRAARTQFQVGWIALRGMEGGVT